MDDGTSKYAIERPEPAGGAAGPMSGPMKANLLERFLRIGSDIAVVLLHRANEEDIQLGESRR